jgi:hypothetical protein
MSRIRLENEITYFHIFQLVYTYLYELVIWNINKFFERNELVL